MCFWLVHLKADLAVWQGLSSMEILISIFGSGMCICIHFEKKLEEGVAVAFLQLQKCVTVFHYKSLLLLAQNTVSKGQTNWFSAPISKSHYTFNFATPLIICMVGGLCYYHYACVIFEHRLYSTVRSTVCFYGYSFIWFKHNSWLILHQVGWER